MLILKGVLGVLFKMALFAALLFGPAGTWDWPRAVQFLVIYGILSLISTIALALYAPASLEARFQAPMAKSQPIEDRVISFFLFLSIFAWFLLIPVEVFHLKILPPPHLMVSSFGALLFIAGFVISFFALYQNGFAAPIVKDQSDRGQVLVDSGLYGRIRHPFYSGLLIYFLGIALWLESYMSVLMLPIIFVLLVARIFIEEKTLRVILPGYIEYMAKVRYRLIPLIW